MQTTATLGLSKPAGSDTFDVSTFNTNMDLIDSRIKADENKAFGSTLIPNGADFNDYKTPGKYHTNALKNYTNAPSGYPENSAYMYVFKQYNPNNSTYIEQRLTLGSNYVEFARRWATDAWSSWTITGGLISKLLARFNAEVDWVVAQGTSGIWTYRKWNSGIAECWGKTASKSYSLSQNLGNGMYYTASNLVAYPSGLFTAAPVVNAEAVNDSTGLTLCSPMNPSKDYFSCRLFAGYASTVSWTGSVHIHAKGRWK